MRSVIKAEIFRLNGARPIEFALQLIYAWAVIIGAIYMALVLNNWFAYIIAGIIVATRQNVLALLVHEQAHDLGFKGRLGDLVVNLLAAYPLLFTLEGYANVHLAHHKFYFTDKDPDFQRKSGKEWETPISKVYLLRLVLADIAGMNVIKLARGKSASGQFKHPFPSWVRLIYYVASAAVLVQNCSGIVGLANSDDLSGHGALGRAM
jgi:fatty acid desaturase